MRCDISKEWIKMTDSSDESEIHCSTRPSTEEDTESFMLHEGVLPQKSQKRYEREYELFVEWCTKHKVGSSYSENVMLAYLSEVLKTKNCSTLWPVYSMLRRTLADKHNVDISKYNRMMAFLRQSSKGHKPKQSKGFKREEIKKFLKDAPNESHLMMKVALLFGVCGACGIGELTNITLDDIDDNGTILTVRIPSTNLDGVQRTFIVCNGAETEIDYLSFYRKYVALRPSHLTTRRLFLKIGNGRCENRVIGKTVIGKIPRRIAEYLNLPDPASYTGHGFKKSAILLERTHTR